MDQHFIAYMVLLLTLAKLLEKPIEKAELSPIVAHIVAGVILGSHILGWVRPLPELEVISYFGLLLLMFYTGMTTNFSELKRLSLWIIATGLCGVVVTFAMIFYVMLALGYSLLKSLIIAVLLSNTATETVAAVIVRSRNEIVRSIAIGASVVDDIAAIVVISMVSSSFLGENPLSIAYTLPMSIIVLMMIILLSEVLVRNPRIFYYRIASSQTVFASVSMILMTGFALLVKVLGLNELIGAYLAGLVVGRGREGHDPLLITETAIIDFLNQLKVFLEAFALPLFFTYVGLLIAPTYVDLQLFVVLLLTAIAGKIVGCGFVTYLATRSRAIALSIGTVMISRGILETALLKILLDAGLIDRVDYTSVLLVAITTIILSPILRKLVESMSV